MGHEKEEHDETDSADCQNIKHIELVWPPGDVCTCYPWWLCALFCFFWGEGGTTFKQKFRTDNKLLFAIVILCADSNFKHTVSKSISSRNQDGALQYKNVGEVNPSFFVDQCWLEDNGVAILNLTSPPTIDISLQVMVEI